MNGFVMIAMKRVAFTLVVVCAWRTILPTAARAAPPTLLVPAEGTAVCLTTDLPEDFTALLKKMNKGLLVTELMGQGVNTVTGDYSRGATGYWIEGGEICYPVEEITIAGNLNQMLAGIIAVGNDVITRGSKQCGSILIDRMTIAGN